MSKHTSGPWVVESYPNLAAVLRVLSLGAGVQSTAMALMSAAGDLPMPDCGIFADTGEEPRATYEHLRWLTGCELLTLPDGRVHARPGSYRGGELPFVVHVCAAWAGHGKPSIHAPLGDEVLAAARGHGTAGSHSRPPFYVSNADGSKGIIRRQCTGDYKIDVIQAKERELLGLRRRQRWPQKIRIEQWIGITTDEATRMKPILKKRNTKDDPPVPHPTIRGRWPLIEKWLSRDDCARWLTEHRYAIPPKSACTFCPFHSNAEWREVRKDPLAWARVNELDRAIRTGLVQKSLAGHLYLHPSLRPLAEVDLSPAGKPGQPNLFENECAGVCGI